MKKKNIFDIIIDIIIILLAILVIYWLLKLIFGGSPELSEFNFGLILIMGGLLFKVYREVGEIKVDINHISNNTKQGFKRMKEDMGLIKKKLKTK